MPEFSLKVTPKIVNIIVPIAPANIPNTIWDKVNSKGEFILSPIVILWIADIFLFFK